MVGLGEGEGSGEKGGEEEKEGRPLNHHHHTAQAALFFNPLPPSLSHFSRFFFFVDHPLLLPRPCPLDGVQPNGHDSKRAAYPCWLGQGRIKIGPRIPTEHGPTQVGMGICLRGGYPPPCGFD